MPSTTLPELITTLRGPTLRVRTGLWVVPASLVGKEADRTAAYGVTAVDIRRPIVDGLLPNQTRLKVTPGAVLSTLDAIIDHHLPTACGLILNLDLLLAALHSTDRDEAWDLLYSGLPHRSRALLLTMPVGASHLLPSLNNLGQWRREGRLAERY